MSDFTASNGIPVWITGDGWLMTSNANRTNPAVVAAGAHVEAIAEFFRAREDDRLGRWRWPENPDYVVYPWGDVEEENSCIAVVNERTGGQSVNLRFSVRGSDESARAARAYFYAHPHPKPWDEAKPGEVWVFTLRDAPELSHAAVLDDCATWTWTDGGQVDLTTITAGRRIWPEVAS